MSDNPIKRATPDHPIHDLLAQRYSPYAFDGRPVEPAKLRSCLEAARWSASSYNEQPWSFILAQRDDQAEFDKALSCLLEANQAWARHAGALLLTVVCRTFTRNGKPNRVAEHDLGLAAASLTFQAESLGLSVHQMAGVELAKVRHTYAVPEGFDPMTAIAIGYAAKPDRNFPSAELAQRDSQPRTRKKLADFVFTGAWKRAAPLGA